MEFDECIRLPQRCDRQTVAQILNNAIGENGEMTEQAALHSTWHAGNHCKNSRAAHVAARTQRIRLGRIRTL